MLERRRFQGLSCRWVQGLKLSRSTPVTACNVEGQCISQSESALKQLCIQASSKSTKNISPTLTETDHQQYKTGSVLERPDSWLALIFTIVACLLSPFPPAFFFFNQLHQTTCLTLPVDKQVHMHLCPYYECALAIYGNCSDRERAWSLWLREYCLIFLYNAIFIFF